LAKRLAALAEHAERIAMLEAKTAAMRAAEKEVTK
jgi:hypothetical protein